MNYLRIKPEYSDNIELLEFEKDSDGDISITIDTLESHIDNSYHIDLSEDERLKIIKFLNDEIR